MSVFAKLTARELEVATLLAAGMPAVAVGIRLGIGYKAVETYQTNARKKLGVQSASGLTLLAVREGLISMHDDPMHDEVP